MIEYVSGNLLEADAEALVNTVNCVGVMGKGIALQFKQAYPDNFKVYRSACDRKQLEPGKMLVVETGSFANPKYIINFPTKRHWRGKSKIKDVDSGLNALVAEIEARGITSVAIPPLGCGNGGLDWALVRTRIEEALSRLSHVKVLVFEPKGAPKAEAMPVATERPKLTRARAILIALLEDYAVPGYRLTMLEIQKLAYFLQVAGEPMRLSFAKQKYGPYAENLHHVLQRLEGHYFRGYGDRSRDASIRLLPGASDEARHFLREEPDAKDRLNTVARLIEGFETPYGLELLATVHWVANDVSDDPTLDTVVEGVHDWSERKRETFHANHIKKAWNRLNEQGLLATSAA